MHHTNYYYGHAHIMARYARLADWRDPPRLWGYLQHGWNILHGFDPRADLVPGVPKLVWSEAPRAKAHELGLRDYHVIGAPWVYLLALEPGLGRVDDDRRRGTIVYPFHGWERQAVIGDHHRLAATIRGHEASPVTVCLYWLEYRMPEVRRAYERAGFRVITHGRRGGDPGFLYRQLAELRRHRRVVSNRLGTAILYGASVGCEVGVYGDPMTLADDDHMVPGGAERIRSEWADMHAHVVAGDVAEKVAGQELGVDQRRDPTEIVELLGWHRQRDDESDRSFAVATYPASADRGVGVADLRVQLRWLDRAVQERDAELRRIRESTSYRVGSTLVRPLSSVRRRLGRKGNGR